MSDMTTKLPVQAVAIDLDGTLLNSRGELTPRTEAALRAARDKGVTIIIATGKTYVAAEWVLSKLKLSAPGVFVQGTTSYNSDGTLRTQHTLDTRIARQVITFAEDRGYALAIYSGKRILVRTVIPRFQDLKDRYHEPQPEAVGALQNILDSIPVNKLVAVAPGGDTRRIAALRWQLNAQIDGSARLLYAGVSDMMEILPPNCSKGGMLKTLLKEMGIKPEQVLAIGDAENDIEMLKLAGCGVAVGNADAAVKAAADSVVASNDADGVAEALERFVLQPAADPAPLPATGS